MSRRSVPKLKLDNTYGCKESMVDGIYRATKAILAGEVYAVCSYGDVRKGSAASLRGSGARVKVTEIDTICVLQAAMDGYEVALLEDQIGMIEMPYGNNYPRHWRSGRGGDEGLAQTHAGASQEATILSSGM